MSRWLRWTPTVLFGVGALFTVGVDTQREMRLETPLAEAIPLALAGLEGEDVTISPAELAVAGVSTYLMRAYRAADSSSSTRGASLYVGYYERQTEGRTIHSPKNCLPGAGWDALASRPATIQNDAGAFTVNHYLLKRGEQTALVLYWYQGRGRVEANEYVVKWDLLRDAALRQRSEEALVRIVVPIVESEEAAFEVAARLAREVVPRLDAALPQ